MVKAKAKRRLRTNRGATLLRKAVRRFGSFEKATADLNRATGGKYLRASMWHWATGQHKPARGASYDLAKWASIEPHSWDE